jgi:hypothetical protein
MKRGILCVLLLSILLPTPGHALRDKQLWGVWKWHSGVEEVDILRLMKKHRFTRQVVTYTPFTVDGGDGREIAGRRESERIEVQGNWTIEEDRIRLMFNPPRMDGKIPTDADGKPIYHVIYLRDQDGKLLLEEQDGEALPVERQRAFEKQGTEEKDP